MSDNHPTSQNPTVVEDAPQPPGEGEAEWRSKQIEKNQAAIQPLRSLRKGNAKEQRETWEFLKKALDEDRLSYRKLFPCDEQ